MSVPEPHNYDAVRTPRGQGKFSGSVEKASSGGTYREVNP